MRWRWIAVSAIVGAIGLITVTVLVVRARLARFTAWLAARRRRKTEGPASWAELRRRASEPASGGIPICLVTRGRTR